ncbi:MAG: hypothetical protein AABY84_02625 [Candidatus Firestonebacteria bacterium]|mgnify:CR=1 FL=1
MNETKSFWTDKIPCWKMKDCSVYKTCPSYFGHKLPCWEIKNTMCDEVLGTHKTCEFCVVYKKYAKSSS